MPNSDRGEGEPCREAEEVCDRGSTTVTLGARPPSWRDPEWFGVGPWGKP
jgi:hypothetical protein